VIKRRYKNNFIHNYININIIIYKLYKYKKSIKRKQANYIIYKLIMNRKYDLIGQLFK